MGFTKFKLLTERTSLGATKSYFPFYDNEKDADFRVRLDVLVDLIASQVTSAEKAVFELSGITNSGNNYSSTYTLANYVTEGIYIFQPNVDSSGNANLNIPSTGLGSLPIQKFDGTDLVNVDDLKAVNTYLLINKTTYWLLVGSSTSSSDIFTSDFTVYSNTFNKYNKFDVVQATGKTTKEVLLESVTVDVFPTYTPASISLSDNQTDEGEVGEVLNNTLTTIFNQNDAGVLTEIRIQKNNLDLIPNGTTSPFTKIDSVTRVNGVVTYVAFANYNAGVVKNMIFPSGNLDNRTPLIRNTNAPQASENNFQSNSLNIVGRYKIFYGSSSIIPTTSAEIRALPSNRLVNAGNVFILNTGTTDLNFIIDLPTGTNLVNVIDLDALNAVINFTLSSQSVNDAGGNAYTTTKYVNTITVPYGSNHRLQITIS